MAITEISRIQHRRGLKESLPQLAAGELGFAVDTQELFIGNGSITDGAPETGNTKIITEDDNILTIANTYTFKGNTDSPIVTGVDTNNAVVRTLQKKLDDFANVKDFGAKGDGSTDDTDAINRAIKNIQTVESTGKQRRRLYFPGGTYIVNGPILIFPFTNILGDGMRSTIIKQNDSTEECVIRTCDDKGNTSANIGSDGGNIPQAISIENMQFEQTSDNHIAILDTLQDSHFLNVQFSGSFTAQGGATNSKACVDIRGTTANTSKHIHFQHCVFEKSERGVMSDFDIQDVVIQGCEFKTLHRGVDLAEQSDGSTANKITGPTGVMIANCIFDGIDVEGVFIHDAGGNPAGNIVAGTSFRNVGKNSDDSAERPSINFEHGNNFAYGNFFHRSDTLSNFAGSIYHEGPVEEAVTLNNNTSGFVNVLNNATGSAVQFDNQRENQVQFHYTITRSTGTSTKKRMGVITAISIDGTMVFSDDFSENADSGIVFQVTEQGILQYDSTNDTTATLKYRILRFV